MTIKVGFDLDRVFINYPPFIPHFVIDFLYRNNFSKTLSYRIPKDRLEIYFRKLSHLSHFRPPIKKNIEFVSNFSKSHKQIYLISSRYSFLEGITQKLLKRYHLKEQFMAVYLNTQDKQPHLFKEEMVKKLGLEIYIDDDLELLKYLKQHCLKVKLLWYSPKADMPNYQGIETITSLSDLKNYLP